MYLRFDKKEQFNLMKNEHFRKAEPKDLPVIWEILKQAISRRKDDGSKQWQDGYPNPTVIENDISMGCAFILCVEREVVGYCALLINDEPEYENIEGDWITNTDFVVFHRLAISKNHIGKGLSKKILLQIEAYAKSKKVFSIKADTNFDNPAMISLFTKMGYQYCGQVYFRGSPRKAYEKPLFT